MPNTNSIDIGKDFSRYPAGRTARDGAYSGQVFVKKVLLPALKKPGKLKILMDGALSYGSSFLEEAFGGVIRDKILTPEQFEQRLEFVSSDEYLLAEVASYVKDATERLSHSY